MCNFGFYLTAVKNPNVALTPTLVLTLVEQQSPEVTNQKWSIADGDLNGMHPTTCIPSLVLPSILYSNRPISKLNDNTFQTADLPTSSWKPEKNFTMDYWDGFIAKEEVIRNSKVCTFLVL